VCARDKQVQSGPLARIYFNLTDNSGQSGAGVNFKYGWATHRKKREKVLEMSPQELTCNVLRILKGEAREEGVHSGQNGGLDSTPHTVARQDTSQPNGLKSGRGGDFLELVKTLIKSPHKKEINNVEAEAIQNIVIDAESEMEKWKEMKQVEETKELTEWRDTEQKKWIVGFLALNQMNGGTISPRNPQ
jgi:hypothetical protein